MNRKRPVILVVLVVYIFLPTFLHWVTEPNNAWYKPFIIWFFVIIAAFIAQTRKSRNDI